MNTQIQEQDSDFAFLTRAPHWISVGGLPVDKRQLLQRLDRASRDFQESHVGLSETQIMTSGVTGIWSVRDILAHVTTRKEEALQFLLGHVSVQTSEKYLGCKQRIRNAVNDRIGIEPSS